MESKNSSLNISEKNIPPVSYYYWIKQNNNTHNSHNTSFQQNAESQESHKDSISTPNRVNKIRSGYE